MKGGKYVILCIDDDKDMLFSLKIILEKNGFHVETASNEDDGIKKNTELKPDLILLDLMMEKVDSALNFMKQINSNGIVPPVFLLSSVGNDFYQSIDAAELGFAGTLQKPVEPDNLVRLIKMKLEG